MKVAWVLPYSVRDIGDACIATCKMDNLLLVDNCETNLGIMRAENIGQDWMRELDADWLVRLSAAVRFGAEGGRDFERHLERSVGQVAVSAVDFFGWHCIAFSRECLEAIGRVDENFSPYGFDDTDIGIRIHKAFPDGTWSRVLVDGEDRTVGMAHSIKLGDVRTNANHQIDYLIAKWGAPHGCWFGDYHDQPFKDHPMGYWPPPSYPPVPKQYLDVVKNGRWDEPCPWPENASVR